MTAVLITCVGLTSLLLLPSGRAETCQMDSVRSSASRALLGGWRATESQDETVVSLMKAAAVEARSSNGVGAALSHDQHVIEAFRQVVNGMNYCIRFSAAGDCDNYQCKSYECIARGHQSRGSDTVSVRGVECHEIQACDIDAVRTSSRSTALGRWSSVSSDDDRVVSLHQTASTIAKIDKGSVAEAYSQSVQGRNYCIQFTAKVSGNCGQHCKELTCIASGFDPLPQEKGNIAVMTKIGVQCIPEGGINYRAPALLAASSHSSADRHQPAAAMATTFAAIAIVLRFG